MPKNIDVTIVTLILHILLKEIQKNVELFHIATKIWYSICRVLQCFQVQPCNGCVDLTFHHVKLIVPNMFVLSSTFVLVGYDIPHLEVVKGKCWNITKSTHLELWKICM